MLATGIIFAGLDCDADVIEAWNRWYDLEHTPPNLSMPGVMISKRYVALPEMHDIRITGAGSPFANGRGTFLTIYTLAEDPMQTFMTMTGLREQLVAADRMFPDEKKIVREGDVMALVGGRGDPAIKAPLIDVPFVGHTSVGVVQRRGSDAVAQWYRDEWAANAVAVEGVHAVVHVSSLNRPGLDCDLLFQEGDAVDVTKRRRAAAPHHSDAEVVLDAPFRLIDPLHYPWAESIRASSLPPTIA